MSANLTSPSLDSVNSTSSCNSSSKLFRSRRSSPSPRPQKDFFSAFGKLQSFYGHNSALVASTQRSHSAPATVHPTPAKKSSKAADWHSEKARSLSTDMKSYEQAFGTLASSYGFGGAAPVLPSRKSSKY
ncbi:hypothetical protein CERSUDRAFT_119738 [Gelatoporia subvermispora B]|uniref:Uncharacterized protein n=1 Tax=Ceriporiopsis subvermispora (strain B) TaxID=914234 RepID=M2QZV9_CERS8|nr:hypothetical protein CERSUDRAFT_119738 [Gelatoporia subvermispora B]